MEEIIYTWILINKGENGKLLLEDMLQLSWAEAKEYNNNLPHNMWLIPNGKEQFK